MKRQKFADKLCNYEGVRSLFIKDEILVGAKIDAVWAARERCYGLV